MQIGKLDFTDAFEHLEQVAKPVQNAIMQQQLKDVFMAPIDAGFADTAAFCEHYGVGMDISANCVVLEAHRADKTWYAACMVLATTRADVNGSVRKYLNARKLSFASMDTAVQLTGMEYGGITPIGLPADWPILVDRRVAATDWAVIGSGKRGSKLLIPGTLLSTLPNAVTLDIVKSNGDLTQ